MPQPALPKILYTALTPYSTQVLITQLSLTLVMLRQHQYPLTDRVSPRIARILTETQSLLLTLDPSNPKLM